MNILLKSILSLVLIFSIICLSTSQGFLKGEAKLEKVKGDLTSRHLSSDSEELIAHIYLQEDYEGAVYDIISGEPRHFRAEKISLIVGDATLRIIDFENHWVYRFAPNESVKEINLKSNNWYATLGKPRSMNGCVMLFERPNYSGYFEELCLRDTEFVNGLMFERRYTSFTYPYDDSIKYVALLGKSEEFQAFNFRSAFSGDLNYMYIFGDIPADHTYYYPARALIGVELANDGTTANINSGRYLFVAGANTYTKVFGADTLIYVSRDRQFVYENVEENVVAQSRLINLVPDEYCILAFTDGDAFDSIPQICYVDYDSTKSDYDGIGYIFLPNDGSILKVILFYDDATNIEFLDSGRTPIVEGKKIVQVWIQPVPTFWDTGDTELKIVASYDDTASYVYLSGSFDFENDVGPYLLEPGTTYGDASTKYYSLTTGAQAVYLVDNQDPRDVAYYAANGATWFDVSGDGISDFKSFYELQDVFDELIDTDCVRLYESCDFTEFSNFQTICVDASENYGNADLSAVRYIAIPTIYNYASVLIYKEDTFDGQFDLTKSTCLPRAIKDNQYITIVPKVEPNHILVFSEQFYTGARFELDGDNEDFHTFDENTDKISIIFGKGAKAKGIDLSQKLVFDIDYNVPKYRTHKGHVTIQSGNLEITNNADKCLWTFDDNDYKDFRALCGGHIYGEDAVSYAAKYFVLPVDTVDIVILVDRRNSIIQTYNREDSTNYLNPIDHTTFGGVERVITLNNNAPDDVWDSVLLARYENFGEYKATIDDSSIIKLREGRHYSFVNSLKRPLRLFNWALINNLKYEPSDAIINFGTQFIEKGFTVGLSGPYGFVLGEEDPINPLYDCVITFDNCTNEANIRRFCMRSRGIEDEPFGISTGPGVTEIKVLITSADFRKKYDSFSFAGSDYVESTCVDVEENSNYIAKFNLPTRQ